MKDWWTVQPLPLLNRHFKRQLQSHRHAQMPQTPLPSLPKVQKTSENLKFFNVCRFPAHLLKSSKNVPRSFHVEFKMHILAPSWPISALSAILPLLFAILSPTYPKNFRKSQPSSQHRRRQPPRCLRHLFRASQKCKKPIKTNCLSMFFAFQPIS